MTNKTIVADAVESVFVLSAADAETVAVAAEKVIDSGFDFRDGCEMIAGVFKTIVSAGAFNFASWEAVRIPFVKAAITRARSNGAVHPEGAGDDWWKRVADYLRDNHSLKKPTSDGKDAVRKAEKREAEKAKAIAAAGGKSSSELKADIKAAFGEATDESIARAKALEKSLKAVEAAEKDAVSSQMKPLMAAANDGHKAIMEFMKTQNDPTLLGDYVVLLKHTLGIWQDQKAQGIIS